MNREERGHHEAASGISGRAQQHPKQQRGAQAVQNHAGLMSSAGMGIVHLHVESVREPGEWVPVSRVKRDECPFDRVPRQAALNVDVFGDVDVVVVVDVGVLADGVIENDSKQDEQ